MYRVEVQKLKSNHSNIKDTVYTGHAIELPQVGRGFRGPIYTTAVKNIQDITDGHLLFQTENSTYELKYTLDNDSQ